jgi:PAS domain S-box-containing protein
MRTHNTRRGAGIERKFLTSIILVGVIPMTLALIIGYVFAYAGQKNAFEENLSSQARNAYEKMDLDLRGRLRLLNDVAQDEATTTALQRFSAGVPVSEEPLQDKLASLAFRAGYPSSLFSLHNLEGTLLISTGDPQRIGTSHPEWKETVFYTRLRVTPPLEADSSPRAQFVVPVTEGDGETIIGFLVQTQDLTDVFSFVLKQVQGRNTYDVVYLSDSENYTFFVEHLHEPSSHDEQTTRIGTVKGVVAELTDQISASIAEKDNGTLVCTYESRGSDARVILAYHFLPLEGNLYIVVYRPESDIFANITLAAMLTLVLSGAVIGLFCIIAYRIVNNTVIRPVSLLNEGAQIIRQGDLELKLKIGTTSKGHYRPVGAEIEELADTFNKMALALKGNLTQLGESEERYRSVINSMRDGIYQTDPNGLITLINPAGVEILGFDSSEEVIGLSVRDLFIEQIDYARVTSELMRNRFVERTRVWMKKQGDAAICVELSTSPLSKPTTSESEQATRVVGHDSDQGIVKAKPGIEALTDGTLFFGMEGTFRDVTHNVRLEKEARERSERIGAINQIANAINSSLEAGRVYDSIVVEVKKLVNFNYASVSLLLGGTEETELPDSDEFLFETRQLWPEPETHGQSSMGQQGPEHCAAWVTREGRNLIVENLHAGDSPFADQFPEEILSCLCVPLYATGRIIGTLSLGSYDKDAYGSHDVEILEQMAPHVAVAIRNAELLDNLQHSLEEVTRAREKLHEAIEELKTLDEMKTNLLSNVSHELRTPLVAVMGYTDMILNGKVGPINEVQHEYLDISLRNIEKLVTLIENLLDFSRLHRGAEEMVFDTFDLVHCARTSIEIVQPVADSRGIELLVVAAAGEVLVEGDKGKLGQVFNNLLSNAVKFNRNNGSVTIEIKKRDDMVEVTVTDTGIGIPKEAQDKIFTRFYQYDASSTRKYGGTGIGLSIAQDIMRLHGSRIDVSSESGKGCVFRFVLPLLVTHKEVVDEGRVQLPLPTETHLLVELVTQDRALSAQIRNLLLSEGMDVIHAAYPAVAISLAEKYSPDCILVDSEAGPLGDVVLEEILSEPAAGEVPIILLTNDDHLYEKFHTRIAGRVKRGFRKSSLLSGIHYALSRGVSVVERLGNKVLCVDDDPEVLKFITRCLEAEGYDVDQCGSGEEALKMAADGDYWLVLLDIAMPGIDGWQTCQKLKSNTSLTGIQVYTVTAKPLGKDAHKIRACGADGYLMKPFKSEDLLGVVMGFESRRPPKPTDNPESTS